MTRHWIYLPSPMWLIFNITIWSWSLPQVFITIHLGVTLAVSVKVTPGLFFLLFFHVYSHRPCFRRTISYCFSIPMWQAEQAAKWMNPMKKRHPQERVLSSSWVGEQRGCNVHAVERRMTLLFLLLSSEIRGCICTRHLLRSSFLLLHCSAAGNEPWRNATAQ